MNFDFYLIPFSVLQDNIVVLSLPIRVIKYIRPVFYFVSSFLAQNKFCIIIDYNFGTFMYKIIHVTFTYVYVNKLGCFINTHTHCQVFATSKIGQDIFPKPRFFNYYLQLSVSQMIGRTYL